MSGYVGAQLPPLSPGLELRWLLSLADEFNLPLALLVGFARVVALYAAADAEWLDSLR